MSKQTKIFITTTVEFRDFVNDLCQQEGLDRATFICDLITSWARRHGYSPPGVRGRGSYDRYDLDFIQAFISENRQKQKIEINGEFHDLDVIRLGYRNLEEGERLSPPQKKALKAIGARTYSR